MGAELPDGVCPVGLELEVVEDLDPGLGNTEDITPLTVTKSALFQIPQVRQKLQDLLEVSERGFIYRMSRDEPSQMLLNGSRFRIYSATSESFCDFFIIPFTHFSFIFVPQFP